MPYSLEELLPFALAGLEKRRDEIDEKIAELRRTLALPAGRPSVSPVPAVVTPTGRRPFSAEARERMAQAQRARWAANRGGHKAPAKAESPAKAKASAGTKAPVKTVAAKKRILSPEARERIAAAQRKRWAAARKAK